MLFDTEVGAFALFRGLALRKAALRLAANRSETVTNLPPRAMSRQDRARRNHISPGVSLSNPYRNRTPLLVFAVTLLSSQFPIFLFAVDRVGMKSGAGGGETIQGRPRKCWAASRIECRDACNSVRAGADRRAPDGRNDAKPAPKGRCCVVGLPLERMRLAAVTFPFRYRDEAPSLPLIEGRRVVATTLSGRLSGYVSTRYLPLNVL